MANPVWPQDVPLRFSPTSYEEIDDASVIYSDVDNGQNKSRRRFNTLITYRRMTLQLSDAERTALRDWLNSMAAGGAMEFDWYPPTGTGVRESVKLIVPARGLRWRRADRRFGEGIRWQVQILVRVVP